MDKEETLYKGFLHLVKKTFSFNSMKDRTKTITHEREVLKVGETVCVVLYSKTGHLLLIEQMRHHGMSVEGICGFKEEEELPLEAVFREVKEEAGINLMDASFSVKYVGEFLPVSGILDMKTYIFAVEIPYTLLQQKNNQIHGVDEEKEETRVLIQTSYVENIKHPCTRIAIDWIRNECYQKRN